MKPIAGRLALLGVVLTVITLAIGACVEGPTEPRTRLAASEVVPSFDGSTTLVCENLVYPVSLCYPFTTPGGYPGQRELLCSALRTESPTFNHPVSGKPATQVFKKTYSSTGAVTGSQETVTIPRPYGLKPQILYFTLTTAQIEQPGMCQGV